MSGEIQYQVQYRVAGSSDVWQSAGVTGPTDTTVEGETTRTGSLVVSGLDPEVQYDFRVIRTVTGASNTSLTSERISNVRSRRPGRPAAGVPADLAAAAGDQSVVLTWKRGAGGPPDGYQWRSTAEVGVDDASATWSAWSATVTETTATATGLTNDTPYKFQVRAVWTNPTGNPLNVGATGARQTDPTVSVTTTPENPVRLLSPTLQAPVLWVRTALESVTIGTDRNETVEGQQPNRNLTYQYRRSDLVYATDIWTNVTWDESPDDAFTITGLTGSEYVITVRKRITTNPDTYLTSEVVLARYTDTYDPGVVYSFEVPNSDTRVTEVRATLVGGDGGNGAGVTYKQNILSETTSVAGGLSSLPAEVRATIAGLAGGDVLTFAAGTAGSSAQGRTGTGTGGTNALGGYGGGGGARDGGASLGGAGGGGGAASVLKLSRSMTTTDLLVAAGGSGGGGAFTYDGGLNQGRQVFRPGGPNGYGNRLTSGDAWPGSGRMAGGAVSSTGQGATAQNSSSIVAGGAGGGGGGSAGGVAGGYAYFLDANVWFPCGFRICRITSRANTPAAPGSSLVKTDAGVTVTQQYARVAPATQANKPGSITLEYLAVATPRYIQATGGTESEYTSGSDRYRVHTFTSTAAAANLVINRAGSTPDLRRIDYLLVAGGGGGGTRHGGGGGAGGMLEGSLATPQVGTYTITVGNGGNGATKPGGAESPTKATNGGNSTLAGPGSVSLTAVGGGLGGSFDVSAVAGGSGGSGGGGTTKNAAGGAGTAGQGNAGGTATSDEWPGAGGGGAGGAGQANSGVNGGAGGAGRASSISGSSVTYAGGGGGGGGNNSNTAGAGGTGGSGGGGNGANQNNNGSPGTNGLGGGGGGARSDDSRGTAAGGNGGSGAVIVRYRIAP